jgi:lipid A 3-O-deacylase
MRIHYTSVILVAAMAAVATPAWAQDPPGDASHGAFSILEENDIFFNTDKHYTNGTALAYTTPALGRDNWAVGAADVLPFFQDHGKGYEVRATYELGQDMFTPANTQIATPDPTDRPYAGFLFLGLGVLSKTENRQDQLLFQAGVIGPASLAQDAQDFVHRILGDKKALGWSHQLKDEPGLELTYERSYRTSPMHVLGFQFDTGPNLGGAIGNVYDYAEAGWTVRGGFNLPDDFGPMRLNPSLPGSSYFEPRYPVSAYLFAGIDARAVGRNLFLEGNSFQSGPRVKENVFVGDVVFGAALETEWGRLAFTHDVRTKEFKTQNGSDQFGAVSLTIGL